PNLKPEKSRNYTLGLVLEPVNALSVSFDWFKIQLKDTIVNGVTPAVILGDLDKYGYLVHRAPAGPDGLPGKITQIDGTNINLGETRLAGYDFDAKLRFPDSGWG